MAQSEGSIESRNKAIVKASFEACSSGAGNPYDLLADDASWSIVGHSAASQTYPSKETFFARGHPPIQRPYKRGPEAYRPQHLRRGRHRDRLLRRQRLGSRRPALCQHLCLVSTVWIRQSNEGVGLL
jgi:hypothetical protein